MAQDSLGKKTHMACVLELFQRADYIWGASDSMELNEARHLLEGNERVRNFFERTGWPFDKRSQQAYVHRFFNWLELPADQQELYPVRILAVGDSVQLRQCLWIDFLFGTPEAQRAVNGLYETMVSSKSVCEVSPETHGVFCSWVGIPDTDNTRRGPFSRWLEDVGFAVPKPDRGANETSVYVDLCGHIYCTPEALIYALVREFADPFDGGKLRPVNISKRKLSNSFSLKSLFLDGSALMVVLQAAQKKGYASLNKSGVSIDPDKFARALVENSPFPSQSWINDDLDITSPMGREILNELVQFPEDECEVDSGSPFVEPSELETIKRRARDGAFRQRVSSAYRYQCALTGFRFRSVSKKSWYGDAAHIIPHSGIDKNDNKVFGSSEISNGIFLSKFTHWCFDRGWLSFEPKKNSKKEVTKYICGVATIAVDDFFERESGNIIEYDGKAIDEAVLPRRRRHWPSVEALEWHAENVFDG